MPFLFSILIVEDEILIAQDVKEILEEVGYKNVFRAKNYKQATEIMETQNIDLVLLDIMMPQMNGLEVLEKLKTKNPKLQISTF